MKQEIIRLRIDSESKKAFDEACAACGTNGSVVMRDLCRLAVAYMTRACHDKNWIPPILFDRDEVAEINQSRIYVNKLLEKIGDVDKIKSVIIRKKRR